MNVGTLGLIRSIVRSRRAGLLKLRKADRPMRLKCKGAECGLCCSVMGEGISIDAVDVAGLPTHAIERKGNEWHLACKGGACALLKAGSCSIYASRPSPCREYPWYNVDGQLFFDSGCPGIMYDRDERPLPSSIGNMRRFFGSSGIFTKFFLFIAERW